MCWLSKVQPDFRTKQVAGIAPVPESMVIPSCAPSASRSIFLLGSRPLSISPRPTASNLIKLPQLRQKSSFGFALRRHSCCTSLQSSRQAEAAFTAPNNSVPLLVDALLNIVDNTDGGVELSEAEKGRAEALIQQLGDQGLQQEPRPLDNELIYGSYDVAFVSTRDAPKQDGQPAGGRFRSKWGRKVFQTRRICQAIIWPDVVTNKVEFALLGYLRGNVGLRGKLQEIDGNRDTVKVCFEPPRLALAGGIDLAIGPCSSVVLTTTYLDYRVRLGRGSRGSQFCFVRGGSSEEADMEQVGLGRTTFSGWLLLLGAAAAAASTAKALWQTSSGLLARAPAMVCGFVAVLVTLAVLQDRFWRTQIRPA